MSSKHGTGGIAHLSSQSERAQPRIDLAESVLLPLFRAAFSQYLRFFNKAANTRRAEVINGIKLASDEFVARSTAGMIKQRPTFLGEHLWPARIVPDAVVDIVSVLLLVASLDRMPFHGQQRRDRTNRDLDAIHAP